MAKGNYILLIFVAGTIIAGCMNSIMTKYQDLQCVDRCDQPGEEKRFEEPVLQTLQMFVGEMLCWIPVLINNIRRSKTLKENLASDETTPLISSDPTVQRSLTTTAPKKSIDSFKDSLILAVPSMCDLLGTTLLNIGLLYTPVSIYQMTRGAIILFVGLFSVAFLKRHISRIEWLSLFTVVFGIFLVGLSGSLGSDDSSQLDQFTASEVTLGMFIIFIGIMFSATQFVVEEHILNSLEVRPLNLVGYEGFYGASIAFIFMIISHIFIGSKPEGREGSFDMVYAFNLMFTHPKVLISSFLIMLFISTFNFFGISLTERLSATARSTIDTSRTLLVWVVSLIIGWESFKLLQLVGFAMLVFGTLVFNGVIILNDSRLLPSWIKKDQPSRQDLLINASEEPIERY